MAKEKVIPDTQWCGAKRRRREDTCRLPAGWGTDHPGVGRCKLHGGAVPIKHGRYSKMNRERLRDSIAEFEKDPDPLNILPELAAARALFQDFVDRFDEYKDALLAWHESFSDEYHEAEVEYHAACEEAETNGDPPPPRPDPLEYMRKPRQILDIQDARHLLSEVTKIVTRIEKIRSENAISRPELFRVMGEMGRVVETYITDEPTLTKIKDGWLGIRLGVTNG